MTRHTLLHRFRTLHVWKRHGRRAPHKPLLLLLALGRVLNGRERLVSYGQIEDRMKELLQRFGPPRKALHPEFPFGRLPADKLWEIPGSETLSRTSSGDLHVGELRKRGVRGGFPEWVHDLLRGCPELAQEAAQGLLAAHFLDSQHHKIRAAVGIPQVCEVRDAPGRPLEPTFRHQVLREYEDRCAVCDFDVRLGDCLVGLEAVLIKWLVAGGPEKVTNGLALCGIHQEAFDRGALGLEATNLGYRVLVSSEVRGHRGRVRWFLDYHDKRLRPPRNRRLCPDPEYVNWHRKEVFRHPPLR